MPLSKEDAVKLCQFILRKDQLQVYVEINPPPVDAEKKCQKDIKLFGNLIERTRNIRGGTNKKSNSFARSVSMPPGFNEVNSNYMEHGDVKPDFVRSKSTSYEEQEKGRAVEALVTTTAGVVREGIVGEIIPVPASSEVDLVPAEKVLGELTAEQTKKLYKAIRDLLTQLHTVDLSTARAIVDTPRCAETRKEIKSTLVKFFTKELKLVVFN